MRRSAPLLAAVAVLAASLAPGLAEARAGGGFSFGSRGGRTYSAPPPTNTAPSFAAPVERSYTPRTAPDPAPGYAPGYAPTPGLGYPGLGYNGGYARRGAFTSGLLGGLVGAGLGGMLFGHGMFGGLDGIGSFFGFLIQIALLAFLARWLFRRFARRTAYATPGASLFRPGMFRTISPLRPASATASASASSGRGGTAGIAITRADYVQFEQVLQTVQSAWSAADLPRLSTVATPEMLGYFNEQLSVLSSRGLRNTVTDVHLQKGDLSEAWSESNREYATVAMRFTMIDTTRDSTGHIVDGSPTEHQTATELWTFVRARGGSWILSAIQQAR